MPSPSPSCGSATIRAGLVERAGMLGRRGSPSQRAGARNSELAIPEIGLDRVHAAENRGANLALGLRDRFGLRDHLLGERLRDRDDAVAVPEDVVAVANRRRPDRDRLAEAVRNPAADDVARGEEAREDREADLEDEAGVAAAAVDDVAEYAFPFQGLGRELAHQRDLVRLRLAHDDPAARRLRQQARPAEQRLVRALGAVDMAGHGPCGAGDLLRRVERADLRRQHDALVAHRPQHVVDGAGVALREAFGEKVHAVQCSNAAATLAKCARIAFSAACASPARTASQIASCVACAYANSRTLRRRAWVARIEAASGSRIDSISKPKSGFWVARASAR